MREERKKKKTIISRLVADENDLGPFNNFYLVCQFDVDASIEYAHTSNQYNS